MLFFGWGRRTKQWAMGEGALVCVYTYIHVWWLFRVAFNARWYVLNDVRSQDRELSRGELERSLGGTAPQLALWDRFGLLFAIAALVLVVAVVQAIG